MFFEYDITVDKNTSETSPVTDKLSLTKGVINRVDVQFPIGCAGLVHCRLEHHTWPHLPNNPSGNFKSDGFVISVGGPIKFLVEPYEVDVIAWNTSTKYDHTITVRFDIIDSESYLLMSRVFEGMSKMLKLMGIKV